MDLVLRVYDKPNTTSDIKFNGIKPGTKDNFDELKTNFCHTCETGNSDHPWPKGETIILFKVDKFDSENTDKLEKNLQNIGLKMGYWHREDNENVDEKRHAEVLILDKYLKKIDGDKFRVEMVVSYSPCLQCCNEMITFKKSKRDVKINIKIANFFKHHRGQTAYLPYLIKSGFELSVFSGGENEWVNFYIELVATAVQDYYQTEHRHRNSVDERAMRENREKYRALLDEFMVQNLHPFIKPNFALLVFSGEAGSLDFYKKLVAKAIPKHYQTGHQYKNKDGKLATRENREKKDRALLDEFIAQVEQ